jgi:hypothetical protein
MLFFLQHGPNVFLSLTGKWGLRSRECAQRVKIMFLTASLRATSMLGGRLLAQQKRIELKFKF